MANLKYDVTMYSKISDIFNLCKVPTSADEIQALIDTMSDSIGTMAMVNYPYATDFVNPLPAWPQKAGCEAAKDTSSQRYDDVSSYNFSNIEALQRGANVFYNYKGDMKCLDLSGSTS